MCGNRKDHPSSASADPLEHEQASGMYHDGDTLDGRESASSPSPDDYEGDDDRPASPQEHGSPSFDYHEERRLHLKDEIYFSHRLPRLPPPAIGAGSYDDKRAGPLSHAAGQGGYDSMSQSFHSLQSQASTSAPLQPGQAQAQAHGYSAAPSVGASPSAFHPTAPYRQMRDLSLSEHEQPHASGNVPGPSAQGQYSRRPTAPSDMLNPSPYNDFDPRPTMLHRAEMDSQERLDLQEERREKELAEHPGRLAAAAAAAGHQAGPNTRDTAQDQPAPFGPRALGRSGAAPRPQPVSDPNLFLSRMLSPPGSPSNSRPPSPTAGGPLGGGGRQGGVPSPLASPPPTPGLLQKALNSAVDLLSFGAAAGKGDGYAHGSSGETGSATPRSHSGSASASGYGFDFNVDLNDDQAMNDLLTECHYYAFAEHGIGNALDSLYASFAKCLDLRDKYLALSNQRLGDNPRDHDGSFKGFYPRSMGDVMGVKPEADPSTCEVPPYPMHTDGFAPSRSGTGAAPQEGQTGEENENELPAWKIYPAPPPPHWHWKPTAEGQAPKLEHRDSDAPGWDNDGAQKSGGVGVDVGEKSTNETQSSDTTGSGPANGPYKTAGKPDMYVFNKDECEIPKQDPRWTFELDDEGVFQVYARREPVGPSAEVEVEVDGREKGDATETAAKQGMGQGKREKLARIPDLREYFTDLDYLLNVCSDGPAKSFAFRRLKYLASKWSLYCLLNEYQELADMKAVPHRDFYNVRKVDTHIHHSASMNQKHLLRFIKAKLKKSPNEIVIHRDGKDLTLAQVFESLNLTAYDLSIDTLDMHAHQEFHRFDRFNDRYNPTGSSRLREIFLKTDNLLKGKYLAELTQELITDLEQSKYQHSEWRLSIYGRNLQEWDKLAKWVVNNKLISHNVRWLIQVPRLYEVFKGGGLINNFEDIVKNVFQPLFEVTADPSSHPELHIFLQRVVGFDSVDDESKPERRLYRKFPTARMWDTKQSPPYSYWIYYMYANMASLNAWRRERGFNTFVLRPHCGEAGDPDHLSSAFLTSHSIAHGILLRKVPALQYLFYLKQIGLAMSPLSNNALFLTYERNPFKDFFRVGLNVSLSTDDPLQFHFTQSHLLEEYSCAAQIYKLTPADMCELARNSVLQSGWEMAVKKHWIGHQWYLPGASGNDIHKTNVPTSRLVYRHQTLLEELTLIRHGTHSPAATPTHLQHANGVPTSAPNTGVPGLAANGQAITSSPVQTFSRPSFPPLPGNALPGSGKPGSTTTYNDADVGAAAMAAGGGSVNDQVAAAAGHGEHAAAHSRQQSLHKQPSMSLGMSTIAGLPPSGGQGVVTAGVGALDEAIHRKRAMSMGKRD